MDWGSFLVGVVASVYRGLSLLREDFQPERLASIQWSLHNFWLITSNARFGCPPFNIRKPIGRAMRSAICSPVEFASLDANTMSKHGIWDSVHSH